jgi:HD-like signal output (HDOD) protein
MSSHWWQRLFGRRPGASRASAVADPLPPTRFAAEEAVLSGVPIPDLDPLPATDPRRPAPLAPLVVAHPDSLARSMAWRVRVLRDTYDEATRRSDGPALVDSLVAHRDDVVRQPPAAAQRALEVSRDPMSSTAQIVSLFENDPSLTQSLLALANSVYYSRGADPVVSIHDAVRRVGLRAVESVLMESMVQGLLCRPGGAFDRMVRMTWTHMQRTAPIARALAPEFGVHPDTAYSLALLHDVGKLVIFDHVSTLRSEVRRELRIPERFFHDVLGHLHEPIGGLAMLRWGMGGEAAHGVGEHHRHPVPETASPLTEALFVAEAVELAHTNHARLDWDVIWSSGGISRDPVAVADRIAALEG